MKLAAQRSIEVRGACQHNLRSLDVSIPRDRIVAFTGVSGSGKSSLAFHTLYAEGQRRYVEALAMQGDAQIERLPRPEVDSIEGLPPTIGLSQTVAAPQPRTLLAHSADLLPLLRLLFARLGHATCWHRESSAEERCGMPLQASSADAIASWAATLPEGTRLLVLAPYALPADERADARARLLGLGLARVRLGGEVREIETLHQLPAGEVLQIVIDRLRVRQAAGDFRARLLDSLATALQLGAGRVLLLEQVDESWREHWFSDHYACPLHPHCALPPLEPALFSLQVPVSVCSLCQGLGAMPEAIDEPCPQCDGDRFADAVCSVLLPSSLPLPDALLERRRARGWSVDPQSYRCSDVLRLPLGQLPLWLQGLRYQAPSQRIAAPLQQGLLAKLTPLLELGLGHLPLERRTAELSRGELQRLRLGAQLSLAMVGAVYIFDEPSTGLHAADLPRLAQQFGQLRDAGSSVLLVEHDAGLLQVADHFLDLGPGAGEQGGNVVAQGDLQTLLQCEASVTGAFLSGRRRIAVPSRRRPAAGFLRLRSAAWRQFAALDLRLPLGVWLGLCGLSGAGKTQLAQQLFLPALQRALAAKSAKAPPPLAQAAVELEGALQRCIVIDASPIGRSSRSTPATYSGVLDELRALYATTREARMRGFGPAHFSFNAKEGRCPVCEGQGVRRIGMHFLPEVLLPCGACRGQRFNPSTLGIAYRGLNLAEVLALPVETAAAHFAHHAKLQRQLGALIEVGLAYLRLDQAASELSGGEAQRLKLATELARGSGSRSRQLAPTLYFFDEPTAGLHPHDTERLIHLLHRLVDDGHSVLVIEHDLDMLRQADQLIELGPGPGDAGGHVIALGTPEELASAASSPTGRCLQKNSPVC